jgi:surface polysaccharide O-acyltransferase-like enzyme
MSTKPSGGKAYHVGADIIRIIACVGVLIIHVTDPFLTYPPYFGIGGSSWWISNVINTFFRVSVPLFIVLSGYLLLDTSRELNIKSFYTRRFLKIGVPTLFWLIIYFIWKYQIGELPSFAMAVQRLLTANLDSLYFLIIILELYFITPLLIVFSRSLGKKGNLYLLLSAFVLTVGNALINQLYPKDAVILQKSILTIFIPYIFYYLLGPYFKKINLSLSSIISLGLLYIYSVVFIAILSEGVVGSYMRQAGSVTIAFLTIISFGALIQLNKVTFLTRTVFIKKSIQYISALVFGAYLVHMMVISLIDWKINLIPGSIPSPVWLFVLIKIGLVIIASFAITAVARKISFLRFLFI